MPSWCPRTPPSKSARAAANRCAPCAACLSAARLVCPMGSHSRRPGPNEAAMKPRGERPPWEDERGRVPLARLFAMALSTLVDDLHDRLAASGFDDVRPAFGYVLLRARNQSVTAKEIAEQNGTSKQAATKLLALMES